MSFNLNIGSASANILYSLSLNTSKLNESMEKISSGLRINRGADDAAGITISEKLRGQIRGLNRAINNCQDGISTVQTADGALNEVSTTLNRIRELSIQAQNDAYTTEERLEIQKEVSAMISAVDEIASKTEFNTKKLLDGSVAHRISTDNKGLQLFSNADNLATLDGGRYAMNVELSEYGIKEIQRSHAFFVTSIGDDAKETSRLSDLFVFREVDFADEQVIIINSHNAKTSVKIDVMTTIDDLCNKLTKAINDPKKDGGLEIPGSKVWFDNKSKQIVVESGLYGRMGQIEYTANESLRKALGFQVTTESEEPSYRIKVNQEEGAGVSNKLSSVGGRTEILQGVNADFIPPMPVETSFEITFIDPGEDWIVMSIIDTNRDIGFGDQWYRKNNRLPEADTTLVNTGQQLISEGYVPEENPQTSVSRILIPPTKDLTPEKFVELANMSLKRATVPVNVRVSITEKRIPVLITGDTGTSTWLELRCNENMLNILGYPYHKGPLLWENHDSGGTFGELAGNMDISIFTAPTDFRFCFTDADGYSMTSSLFLRGDYTYYDMATQLNSELRAAGLKISLYTDTSNFRAISTESGTDTIFQIDVIVPQKAMTLTEDVSFTVVDTNRDIGDGRIPDGVPQTAEVQVYIPAGYYTLNSIEDIINQTIADIPDEFRPSLYAVFSDDYDGRSTVLSRSTRESGYVVYDGSGDFILQFQDNHVGTSSYLSVYDVNPAAAALLGLHTANATGISFAHSTISAEHCILEPVYNPRFAISITDADGRAFRGVDIAKNIDLRDYPFESYITDNELKVVIEPFSFNSVLGTTIQTTIKDHQIDEEFNLTFREYWKVYERDDKGYWFWKNYTGEVKTISVPVGLLSDFDFAAALSGSTFGVTISGDKFTAFNHNPKSETHSISMTVSGANISNFNEGVEKLGLESMLGHTFFERSTETGNDTIFNTQFVIAPLLRAESPIKNDMVQNSFIIKTTDYHGGVFVSDAIDYGVNLAGYDFNAINPDNLVYIRKMPDGHLEFEAVHTAKDIEYKVEFLEASNFLGSVISPMSEAFGDFRLAVIRDGVRAFGDNITIDTALSTVGDNYLNSPIATISKLNGKIFTESKVFGDDGYELRVEAKAHKLGDDLMIVGEAPADFTLSASDSFIGVKILEGTDVTGVLHGYNLGGATLSFVDGKLTVSGGDKPIFVKAASYATGGSVSGINNQDIRFVVNRNGNKFYSDAIAKGTNLSSAVNAGMTVHDVNIGLKNGVFFAGSNSVDDGSFSLDIEGKAELLGTNNVKSDLTLDDMKLVVTRGSSTVMEEISAGTDLSAWVANNGNAFSSLGLDMTIEGGKLKLKSVDFGGPIFSVTTNTAEGVNKFGMSGTTMTSVNLNQVKSDLSWSSLTYTNSEKARKDVMRVLGLSSGGFRLRINSDNGIFTGDKIDANRSVTDILNDYNIGSGAITTLRDGKLFIQAVDHENDFSVAVEAYSFAEAAEPVTGVAGQDFRIVTHGHPDSAQYMLSIGKGEDLHGALASMRYVGEVEVGLRNDRLFAESTIADDSGFFLTIEGKAEAAGSGAINAAVTSEGFTIQIIKNGQTIEQQIAAGENINNWLESADASAFLSQVSLTANVSNPGGILRLQASSFDSQSFELNIIGNAAQIAEGVNRLGLSGANLQSTDLADIKSQLKWNTLSYTSSSVIRQEVLATLKLANLTDYTTDYIANDVGLGLGLPGRSVNSAINANILNSLGFENESAWTVNPFSSHSEQLSPYDIHIVLERMGFLKRGADFNSPNGHLPEDTSKIAAGRPYNLPDIYDDDYNYRARFRPNDSVAASTNPYISWAADPSISYGALYMAQLLGIADAQTAATAMLHNEDRVMLKSSSGTGGNPIVKGFSLLPRTYITENEEKEFTVIDRYGNEITISLFEQIDHNTIAGISREGLIKKMAAFENTDIHWEFENDTLRLVTKTAGEKATFHLSKELDKEILEPHKFAIYYGYGENDYNFMVGDKELTYQAGANQRQHVNIRIGDFGADALGIRHIDCTSVRFATAAIGIVDNAIKTTSSTRSMLGAYQNRMSQTMDNLHNTSINLQGAESKIRDVDVAEETVENQRRQFLRQAATQTFQDNIQIRKQIAGSLLS